jgi:hypothetical protein
MVEYWSENHLAKRKTGEKFDQPDVLISASGNNFDYLWFGKSLFTNL